MSDLIGTERGEYPQKRVVEDLVNMFMNTYIDLRTYTPKKSLAALLALTEEEFFKRGGVKLFNKTESSSNSKSGVCVYSDEFNTGNVYLADE